MLTAEEVTQEVMVCRKTNWDHIAKTVTSGMNEQLKSPMTEGELQEAMRVIPRSGYPGEDGLPILFFEVHWDIIGGKLVEVCNEIFRTRHIPKEMSTGLIYMIPKGSS